MRSYCVVRLVGVAVVAILAVLWVSSIPPYTIGLPPGVQPGAMFAMVSYSDLANYFVVLLVLSCIIVLIPRTHKEKKLF